MVGLNKVSETAAGGSLGVLITKLASLSLDQCSELLAISSNIKCLQEELEILHAVLLDLSNEEDPSQQMKLWKNKIRELSYDMEDVIDKYELASKNSHARSILEARDPNFIDRVIGAVRSCTDRIGRLPSDYETAKKIQSLKDRVTMSEDRHKRLKTASHSESTTKNAIAIRDLAPYADPADLVGIDAPRDKIISWLTHGGSTLACQRIVVAIVGFGGLGKTTLAKQVFDKIHGNFRCKAFVPVSRNPDINKVLRDILVDLSGERPKKLQEFDERQLRNKLRECTEGKRYLVVLDDVWSQDAWEQIKSALYNNNHGSRIIVTTRGKDVAQECCRSKMGHLYELKPLDDDKARHLFMTRVFPHKGCPPNLEDVCHKVLKKCGGSPLAILTLSGLLANKETPDQCEEVLNSLNYDSSVDSMRRILSFSYFDLPQNLRTCLLYLSLFPEDTVIKRKRLVNRWIAEGFIGAEVGKSKTRTGEHYFNELISRCLIQPVYIKYDGQARACVVHDTILDFIVHKSIEEKFVTFLSAQEGRPDKRVRHLSIQDIEKFTGLAKHEVFPARSLTVFGNSEDMAFYNSILRFSCLRVLDLEDIVSFGSYNENVGDDDIIVDVSQLCHLKYFKIGRLITISIGINITGIVNLQCLETLDLRQSTLSNFPEDTYKLQQLVRLFIDRDIRLPGGIGEMKVLEELKIISAHYTSQEFLQDLGQLTKLRSVGFYLPEYTEKDCEKELLLITSLCKLGMSNLQSLTFVDSYYDEYDDCAVPVRLDGSVGLSWHNVLSCIHKDLLNLRKFQMKGGTYFTKFPKWMSSLNRLEKLKLSVEEMEQEDLEILGGLGSLLYLVLALDKYPTQGLTFRDSTRFQCLKYLEINCNTWWTILAFEAEPLPRLEHLQIQLKGSFFHESYDGDLDLEAPCGFSFYIDGALHSLTRVDVNINHYTMGDNDDPKDAAETIRNEVNALPNKPKFQISTDAL